jgi:hypothetical protein
MESTAQEINNAIATRINGWVHNTDIFYLDSSGNTQYLADYCNSVPHSLDLAKKYEVGLAPTSDGWLAYSVVDSDVKIENALPGTAISLCVLKIHDASQAQAEQAQSTNTEI